MANQLTFSLVDLFCIIEERKKAYQANPESKADSYTAFLLDKGLDKIQRKVHEETLETIMESHDGNKERLVEEMSDLIYHLCVLAASHDVSHDDIMGCLSARHQKKTSE